MTTREEKTAAEHVATSLQFLEHSDREFEAGDSLQGSENLWGAASYAVIAVSKQRGWSFNKHPHLRVAVRRLAEELDDDSLPAKFSVAEKFHSNFYRDFMYDDEIENDRPIVNRFVRQLVDVVEAGPSS